MKDEIQFLIAIAAIKKKSLCHFVFYMRQESIVDCKKTLCNVSIMTNHDFVVQLKNHFPMKNQFPKRPQ